MHFLDLRNVGLLSVMLLSLGCTRIERLEQQTSVLQTEVLGLAGADESTSRRIEALQTRVSQLEQELEGLTLFRVDVPGGESWFDVYANQSGKDRRVSAQLVCVLRDALCARRADDGQTVVRVLGIIADAEADIEEFPVVENTVVVDTGPLDLSAPGAIRELVVPRGFRIIAQTASSNGVRLRVLIIQ